MVKADFGSFMQRQEQAGAPAPEEELPDWIKHSFKLSVADSVAYKHQAALERTTVQEITVKAINLYRASKGLPPFSDYKATMPKKPP